MLKLIAEDELADSRKFLGLFEIDDKDFCKGMDAPEFPKLIAHYDPIRCSGDARNEFVDMQHDLMRQAKEQGFNYYDTQGGQDNYAGPAVVMLYDVYVSKDLKSWYLFFGMLTCEGGDEDETPTGGQITLRDDVYYEFY